MRVGDAAELRFAVSPLWETVRSLYPLADPGRHAVHLPWIRRVRSLAARYATELAPLRALARPGAWLPDFLTPPPPGPDTELEQELAVLAATPSDVVAEDLRATTARAPLPPRIAGTDPAGLVADLVAAVRLWHEHAIAPSWPRMRALLDADIAYRSRQLAEGGVRQLFDTLHPTVRWAGDRVVADDPWELELDLRGRGMPLMPSVFVDRRVLWTVRADSRPLAVYPVRAAGTLWERRPPVPDALAAVLGATRAALLDRLRHPATTSELARHLGISAAAVSQQLALLYAAGLVTRAPRGRTVLYVGTAAGTALLDGVGER